MEVHSNIQLAITPTVRPQRPAEHDFCLFHFLLADPEHTVHRTIKVTVRGGPPAPQQLQHNSPERCTDCFLVSAYSLYNLMSATRPPPLDLGNEKVSGREQGNSSLTPGRVPLPASASTPMSSTEVPVLGYGEAVRVFQSLSKSSASADLTGTAESSSTAGYPIAIARPWTRSVCIISRGQVGMGRCSSRYVQISSDKLSCD